MTESAYTPAVGRKPLVGKSGDRLKKYAVKLFPSQWDWLASVAGSMERSEYLRELIERAKRRDGNVK